MRAGFFTSCKVRMCPIVTSRVRVLKARAGTFAESSSPEDQLHWIFENCKVVRGANGLPNIVEAMKIASSKHDLLWSVVFVIRVCFEGSLTPSTVVSRSRMPPTSKFRSRTALTSWRRSPPNCLSISACCITSLKSSRVMTILLMN